MYCVVISYPINRISASNVQFRARSSITGQGGTTHPAAELTAHPLYSAFGIDFDVTAAMISDNVCQNLIKKPVQTGLKHD